MVEFADLQQITSNIGDVANNIGNVANNIPWSRGAYRQFCRVWAGTGVPQALDAVNVGSACSPYLAEDGRTFGTNEVPFTGGQCPDFYSVTVEATVTGGGLPDSDLGPQTRTMLGPINTEKIFNTEGSNNEVRLRIFGARPQDELTFGRNTPGSEDSPDGEFTRIDLTPLGGNLDDCGDPPGQFQPGQGYQGEDYGDPVTYTGPDGNDYDLTVFVPTVRPDGTIELNVDVGDIAVNLGNPGRGGGFAPGPTEVGDIDNLADGTPEDVAEPPEGFICVAVAIQVDGVPASEGTIPETGPENTRYTRTIGSAAVHLETGVGRRYWSRNIDIKSRRQVIAIPVEGLQIVGVRVKTRVGNARYEPIYRKVNND